MTKRDKMFGLMVAAIFIAYNITVFVVAGFDGHGPVFWWAYVYMLLAVALIIASVCVRDLKRDWLFGYPVFLHNVIYLSIELILSFAFMILDKHISWEIPFVVQFVIMCIHVVFVISAFYAKETVKEVNVKIREKQNYIRLLRVEVELIRDKCQEDETKSAFSSLAEAIRFSDPVSSALLAETEQELNLVIAQARQAIVDGRKAEALQLCGKAQELLAERNLKCRALK